MVVDKYGIGKKYFIAFAIIAVVIVGMEIGMLMSCFSTPIDGEYKLDYQHDEGAICGVNPDVGLPSLNGDIVFYELALSGRFKGKSLNIDLREHGCVIEYVFSYLRNPDMINYVNLADGDESTVINYVGTNFDVQIPENLPNGKPWVLLVGVTSMAWNGVTPICKIYADITLL